MVQIHGAEDSERERKKERIKANQVDLIMVMLSLNMYCTMNCLNWLVPRQIEVIGIIS